MGRAPYRIGDAVWSLHESVTGEVGVWGALVTDVSPCGSGWRVTVPREGSSPGCECPGCGCPTVAHIVDATGVEPDGALRPMVEGVAASPVEVVRAAVRYRAACARLRGALVGSSAAQTASGISEEERHELWRVSSRKGMHAHEWRRRCAAVLLNADAGSLLRALDAEHRECAAGITEPRRDGQGPNGMKRMRCTSAHAVAVREALRPWAEKAQGSAESA